MEKEDTAHQNTEILKEDISFTSERILFAPAWNVTAEELSEQANDLEIATAVGEAFPNPYTVESAQWFIGHAKEEWVAGREFSFAIRDSKNDFMGMIGFKVNGTEITNIGYWLGKEFWGNGYATEALSATLGFIKLHFPLVKIIKAGAFEYNVASQRVLEKFGFVQKGISQTDKMLRNGKPGVSVEFELVF